MSEESTVKLPDDLKFEGALAELEGIVEKLETGELDLEDCLKQFQKGTALAKFCEKRLNETAKQLEILRKTGPASAEFQAVEPDQDLGISP